MTQPGSSSYRFACPKCGNRLRAEPSQAGTRCDCPKCGAAMRVPAPHKTKAGGAAVAGGSDATGGAAPGGGPVVAGGLTDSREQVARGSAMPGHGAKSDARPAPEPQHVGFPCDHCGTRLHALVEQVGQKIECPDCGVYVRVPPPAPPKPKSAYATPFEEIEAYEVEDPAEVRRPELEIAVTPEFSFSCLVCESRLSATADQIGTLLVCPDCGHRQMVRQPKPKPVKRPPPAIAQEEREPYGIDRPIETPAAEMYVDTDEEALGERAKALGYGRKSERPRPPERPFVSGVANFLASPGVPFRVFLLWPWMALWVFLVTLGTNAALSGGVATIGGMAFIMSASVLTILWTATAGAVYLSILQDTANGNDEIDWPDGLFVDWMFSILIFIISCFYTLLPAVAAIWILGFDSFSALKAVVVLGDLFFVYPIVLLSLLETSSLFDPFSPPVWRSMKLAAGAWVKFYLASAAFLGVTLFVAMASTYGGLLVTVAATTGAIVILGMFYARLLGRLAWVSSDAIAQADDAAEEKKARDRPPRDSVDRAHEVAAP